MKVSFLTFALVIGMTLFSFAQNSGNSSPFTSGNQSFTNSKITMWVWDSTLYYSTYMNSGLSKKEWVKQRDAHFNPTLIISEKYDLLTNEKIGTDSICQVFYDDNTLHKYIRFQWDKSNQTYSDTVEYKEYNQLGLPLIEIYKTFSTSQGVFKNGTKTTYQYNDDNTCNTTITDTLDTASMAWIHTEKRSFTYLSDTTLPLRVDILSWDKSSQQWQNQSRIDYNYYSDTRYLQKEIYSIYTNGTFAQVKTVNYQYDTQGRDSVILTEVWDDNLSRWVLSAKTVYSYTDTSYSYITMEWNIAADDWENQEKYVFIYDNQNRLTLEEKYTWSSNDQDWIGYSKKAYTYDENNLLVKIDLYSWMYGSWVQTSEQKYYYSQVTYNSVDELTSNIVVYPNPAHNLLIIKSFNHPEIQIFTLTGKLVLHTRLTSNQLNVSHLRPGIYILVLKDKGTQYTIKFTKQ